MLVRFVENAAGIGAVYARFGDSGYVGRHVAADFATDRVCGGVLE